MYFVLTGCIRKWKWDPARVGVELFCKKKEYEKEYFIAKNYIMHFNHHYKAYVSIIQIASVSCNKLFYNTNLYSEQSTKLTYNNK